jgi:FAD synthase
MIYDQPIQVDFLARLREIRRFDTVDALLAQLARDVARTVEIVGVKELNNLSDTPPSPPRL